MSVANVQYHDTLVYLGVPQVDVLVRVVDIHLS